MTEGLYWDGIERMIFKDGKRVELCEEGVEIGGARVLNAVRRVCKGLYRVKIYRCNRGGKGMARCYVWIDKWS